MRVVFTDYMSSAAIMRLTYLKAALMLGLVTHQMSGLKSPSSDCLSAKDICMSDLCSAEKTLQSSFCEENVERCQMKGSLVCNMSLQALLELFPSLRGCVCAQEGDLCDSIPALAAQCHQKPEAQHRSLEMDWQSSTLQEYVHNAGSCMESIRVCLSDAVCNRLMAPVLQECMGPKCKHKRCQQATLNFYNSMPLNVAEMLVMCKCQASDESCLQMRNALHSGTCGDKTWVCLDAVKHCVKDRRCRELLNVFHVKCWRFVDPQCLSDPQTDCLTQMNPAFILGSDTECQTAFIATLGTALHYPCSCKDVLGPDLQTCYMIHDVFHNRTHFMKHWMSSSVPTVLPEISQSEEVPFGLSDYLLSGVTCMLLVGIVPLAILVIIWLARRRKKNKFHNFQKSHTVIF